MNPQSNFMIVAPVAEGCRPALEDLLEKMNHSGSPGMADPDNAVFPFGEFDVLHFSRFVILDDKTLGDFEELDLPVPDYPITLAFLGDCDGPADDVLNAFATHPLAAAGLRKIFSNCAGFSQGADLVAWMKAHEHPPAAAYVNWIGRPVQQVREEAALREALCDELSAYKTTQPDKIEDVAAIHRHLQNFVEQNPALAPTPTPRTPISWLVRNALHFAIIPALLLLPWLIAIPFLMPTPLFFWIIIPSSVLAAIVFAYLVRRATVTLAITAVLGLFLVAFLILFRWVLVAAGLALIGFIVILRHHEKTEPEIIRKPTDEHIRKLAVREDYDVTNQFTIVGSVKPGRFRRWLTVVLLWLIDYAARHIYNRGHLGRIQTIHFARWTFIDDKKRLIFASNYDGSLEAYMDDFINKVGWGLNLAFGGGVGYPRVNWLILNGSREEQKFKYTLRRHQLPTEVWYKAYPGLTAFDLARNSRVHTGIKRARMSEAEIRAWLHDL